MKSKALLWSIVAVVILGLTAGGLYWWLLMPQVITLSDGTKLTLVSVTYGKKHSAPKTKINGHKVRGGSLTTTKDSICLWIDQKHGRNQWPNYQLIAYDSANTGCQGSYNMTYGNMGNVQGEEVVGICFEAFPRRSGTINFRVQEWNMRNGQQEAPPGHFTVHNPGPRSGFEKWTPDTLPNSQSDDDLQVTLDRCEIVGEQNMWGRRDRQTPSNDPINKGVLAAFHIEQSGIAVTNWQPVSIQTSDATGNLSHNRSWSNRQEDGDQVMVYQWGLWPNETAWKLRVEMSRTSGFHNDEIGTLSAIPLKDGDINDTWNPSRRGKPAVEINIGETKVQAYPVVHMKDSQRGMYGPGVEGILLLHLDPPPKDSRITTISISDEQGKPIEFMNWGSGGNEHRVALKNLGDVKAVNITLAVHHSRYLEYTVKPVAKK